MVPRFKQISRLISLSTWISSGSLAVFTLACGQSSPHVAYADSKLDAEESGYDRRFRDVHTSVSNIARELVDSISDETKYKKLGDSEKRKEEEKILEAKRTAIFVEAVKSLMELKKTIPPAAMAQRHERLITLLSRFGVGSCEDEAIEFLRAATSFNDAVERRSPRELRDGELSVSYQPPRSPISVGVGIESGDFSVSVGASTPYGNFSVSASGSSHIKLLVIRSFGKQRFFSLDRSFKVLTPPGYGVEISMPDGGDTMVVSVMADARVSDTRQPPRPAAAAENRVALAEPAPVAPTPAKTLEDDDGDTCGTCAADRAAMAEEHAAMFAEEEARREDSMPWRIQVGTYNNLTAARNDADNFLKAGLNEPRYIRQGDFFVLLMGQYASKDEAFADTATASSVRRDEVVVVYFPRWCPVLEAHEAYDECSIWGFQLDFATDEPETAKRKQAEYSEQHLASEILKLGEMYHLSQGPYSSKSQAHSAAIKSGLPIERVRHLDNICPERQQTVHGYLICGEWAPRSYRVPYRPPAE